MLKLNLAIFEARAAGSEIIIRATLENADDWAEAMRMA